ncbi:MAG: enterochelin esterase, partial [Candidatus Eremiobacteraeota bacterium]|nr:enterochelin esterase [Candidatus Eremiobacteraeota bacterium]
MKFACWLLYVALFTSLDRGLANAAEPQYLHVSMRSAALSNFWGQPVSIDAHVLLPDSYYKDPQRHYPVMYWVQGFMGLGDIDTEDEATWQAAMRRLNSEFILVFLNGMFNWSHQEFADSANNGPWGTALVGEFIPQTETRFRAIGTPQTRFVGGHSSGGWSALWLQVTYPDVFGGEWSLSPDPVDFRNFSGPDLTKNPPQNFFNDEREHFYTLYGQPLRWFVVGAGWERHQFESFDAVFSPRGSDGKPEPLFDRKTGVINPTVAAYWEAHYDISRILQDRWSTLGPQLRGKLHIFVGDDD